MARPGVVVGGGVLKSGSGIFDFIETDNASKSLETAQGRRDLLPTKGVETGITRRTPSVPKDNTRELLCPCLL